MFFNQSAQFDFTIRPRPDLRRIITLGGILTIHVKQKRTIASDARSENKTAAAEARSETIAQWPDEGLPPVKKIVPTTIHHG